MTVPWVAVEGVVFELACIAVGAMVGLVVTLVRLGTGERHGAH